MSESGKKFFAPQSVDNMAKLFVQHSAATILAGGTDVGLWVTKQHRELDVVIYTGTVAELTDINLTSAHIEIGAAVSLTDAMQEFIARTCNDVLVASSVTNDDGRTAQPLLDEETFREGLYELEFAVGDYFKVSGAKVAEPLADVFWSAFS